MIRSKALVRSVGCALAGAAASWAIVTGQDRSPSTGARALVQEIGLPGIDRGIRRQDMPRDPSQPAIEAFHVDRAAGPLPDMVPGGVIVKFRPGADRNAAVAATLSQVSGIDADRPSWANFEVLTLAAGDDPERASAELGARADVEYAQPRYRVRKQLRPNDPLYPDQWNFPALDMERAWDIQPGATAEVVVAVLDTGMAFRSGTFRYISRFPFRLESGGPVYPALGVVDVPFAAAPELGESSRFVAPHDFIWNDTEPVDLDGHGTHVSGTIGQLTNNSVGVAGMAFNVRLMPVKVIDDVWDFVFGSPESGTDDTLARGIRYAVDNGAQILNMSIGRHAGGPAPVVEDALRYAVGRGAFIAIASGNTREMGNEPNRIGAIAPSLDGCVVVGAVGRSLDLAYYSTTGASVELVAPGGDTRREGAPEGAILQQTLDQDLLATYTLPPSQFGPPRADSFAYYFSQGTSMATPHVSGFAALLIQQGITDPAAIEAAMKHYATDKGSPGRDDEYGVGLINPRATLRGLGLGR